MADTHTLQLLEQLEALASDTGKQPSDPALRSRLAKAALDLHRQLEDPEDLTKRILISQPVEGSLVNIASDLELFAKLADTAIGPWTPEKLSASLKVKTDPILLKRVLRGLAAFGAIKEVDGNAYVLSQSYSLLAKNPDFGHALVNCSNILNPTYHALPGFLASIDYANPVDPMNTAVQGAFGSGKSLLDVLMSRPADAQGFGKLMQTWGEESSLLQEVYPVSKELGFVAGDNDVLFVDVGGSYGQKAKSLKEAFPYLPGRFVVQDLPNVVENAKKMPPIPGVEFMAHDFTTKQPIEGACTYYIRQCLHNWPDVTCIQVLSHLSAAMSSKSKLLIHELITPETGASVWQTTQDINMMALLGCAERSEEEWRAIIKQAGGLEVTKIYLADDGVSESVIECRRI